VVLENASIEGVGRLEESLVGRNAKISKSERPEIVGLNVGDYFEIEI